MSNIAYLCLLCAISAVCVTLTVCIVLIILSVIDEIWKLFRKSCRWIACQIRDEMQQADRQEAEDERQRIHCQSKSEKNNFTWR